MAATLPRTLFMVSGPRDSNSVCLTFDDGPHPEHTVRVLDVLRRESVPATFFVIGERAEKCPDVVRCIVQEGHTLGHQTFFHTDPAQTSASQLLAEVRRTTATLSRIVGKGSCLVPTAARQTDALQTCPFMAGSPDGGFMER